MVSRITLNLKKQASRDIMVPRSDGWTPSSRTRQAMRTGLGSAGSPWTHSLTTILASTMPRRNSAGFRSDPASYPARVVRLNTIYSASVAMTPVTASFVSEEAPIFHRPGVEQDVEAM